MSIIPVVYYHMFFFNSLLVFILLIFIQTKSGLLESNSNKIRMATLGFFLLIYLLIIIGLRPLNYRFGDMVIYDRELELYRNGAPFDFEKDFLFECIKFFFAKNSSSDYFFIFCAILYIIPLYAVSKKLFKEFWFYAFFMFIASFSFWAYGVNGVRNGVATSLFLYGIVKDKSIIRNCILVSTIFIHKSMAIPLFAYFLSQNYKNTKVLFAFWLIAIPTSFIAGGFFESLFLGLGFGDEKLEMYLGDFNASNEGVNINVGFRWDFLLYSSFGIFAIWYFLFKRKLQDPYYTKIGNMYIIANTFWVLVIRDLPIFHGLCWVWLSFIH